MPLSAPLVRFVLIYAVVLAGYVVLMHVFGAEPRPSTTGVPLATAVVWVCSDFARRHGRYFNRNEMLRLASAMWSLDLLVLVALAAFPSLAGAMRHDTGTLPAMLILVAGSHALIVAALVAFGRHFARKPRPR